MADMIPPNFDAAAVQGTGPATAGGGQSPPPSDGSSPDDSSADPTQQGSANPPDPATMIPADAQGQSADGADDGGPRATGTQQQADRDAVDSDPFTPVEASPEEQAQYHELVTRFLLFISDQRAPNEKIPSPMDSVLSHLNDPKVPLATAIGRTVAGIVFTIVHAAKVQGVTYEPEVLFYASDELCAAVYLLGNARGYLKGVPPFKGMPEDGNYDFDDREVSIIQESKMQAVRAWGNLALGAGLITDDIKQENMAFWKSQIQREVDSNSVSDEVMSIMQKKGVFDKIHEQLGTQTTGGAMSGKVGDMPNPLGASDASTADSGGGMVPPDDTTAASQGSDNGQ
jgi:hypothetical protein